MEKNNAYFLGPMNSKYSRLELNKVTDEAGTATDHNYLFFIFLVCMFQVHCGGTIDGGPLLTKEYPIKYSLQWFLLKPSHGGFGNFFPLVPMLE